MKSNEKSRRTPPDNHKQRNGSSEKPTEISRACFCREMREQETWCRRRLSSIIVKRNDLKAMILIFFTWMFLVISYGCSQPKGPELFMKTAGSAHFCNGDFAELPVHYETQIETLARIRAASEAAKDKVDGLVHEDWLGNTLFGLGRLRNITVPYVSANSDGKSREVTTLQIQKALTEYVLIDFESSRLSVHIPMGTWVIIEYENGMVGQINMHAGIPWTVSVQKDGRVGTYGLRKTPEQSTAPQIALPPR